MLIKKINYLIKMYKLLLYIYIKTKQSILTKYLLYYLVEKIYTI